MRLKSEGRCMLCLSLFIFVSDYDERDKSRDRQQIEKIKKHRSGKTITQPGRPSMLVWIHLSSRQSRHLSFVSLCSTAKKIGNKFLHSFLVPN